MKYNIVRLPCSHKTKGLLLMALESYEFIDLNLYTEVKQDNFMAKGLVYPMRFAVAVMNIEDEIDASFKRGLNKLMGKNKEMLLNSSGVRKESEDNAEILIAFAKRLTEENFVIVQYKKDEEVEIIEIAGLIPHKIDS